MKISGILTIMQMYTALDAVQGNPKFRRIALKNREKEKKNQQISDPENSLHHLRFLPKGKKIEENEYIASTQHLYANVASDADNEFLGREMQGRGTRHLEHYSETRREDEDDPSFWERELRGSGMRLLRLVNGAVDVKDSLLSNEHQGHRSRRLGFSQGHDGGNIDSFWERELQGSGRRRLDFDKMGEYVLDQKNDKLMVDNPFQTEKPRGGEEKMLFQEGGLHVFDERRGRINLVEGEYSEFWERELQQS